MRSFLQKNDTLKLILSRKAANSATLSQISRSGVRALGSSFHCCRQVHSYERGNCTFGAIDIRNGRYSCNSSIDVRCSSSASGAPSVAGGGYGKSAHTSNLRGDAISEEAIKTALGSIIEPVTRRSFLSLGAVQGIHADRATGTVKLDIDFMVPGHPRFAEISAACTTAVTTALPWVKSVQITDLSRPSKPHGLNSSHPALASTAHFIAVSSCKGGVGKSTVAVNLAAALAQRGLRVGLLDADVYGPSLPFLLPAENTTVRKSSLPALMPNGVLPLTAKGLPTLKMLSFGHVSEKAGVPGAGGTKAAVVRGPIVSKVITQLVTSTEWGSLDYLVVDMPPGTGDIQITLTQTIAFSGAIVVTTPHALSLADAAKGVQAFESLQVPVLALVENMAYFEPECEPGFEREGNRRTGAASDPSTGTGTGTGTGTQVRNRQRYYPLGRGGREGLLKGLNSLLGFSSASASAQAAKKTGPTPAAPMSRLDVIDMNKRAVLQRRLEECPLFQLPMSATISGGVTSYADAARNNATGEAEAEAEVEAEAEEELGPVVQRCPQVEASKTYRSIADCVIEEILRLKLNAQMVPALTFVPDKGVVLRYFSRTSAEELIIPVWDLRSRDPITGTRRAEYADVDISDTAALQKMKDVFKNAAVQGFSIQGNYGVMITWSDTGTFMDKTLTNVFSFEVLRRIAEEARERG